MKNWALKGLRYDLNPSPYNYINSRWSHFHFCRKDDPTITASLYLDNLTEEVKNEIQKQPGVNKKSLTLAVIKRTLENKVLKHEMIMFFERTEISKEEINQFLARIASFNEPTSGIEPTSENPPSIEFPARTYVIATHIYLEINNNELHYETLIRDTTALKEFITSKFKAQKLPGRIAEMKNFSYKKLFQGRSNEGAKGQLKPQLKQIANTPEIFGKDVAQFAADLLETNF